MKNPLFTQPRKVTLVELLTYSRSLDHAQLWYVRKSVALTHVHLVVTGVHIAEALRFCTQLLTKTQNTKIVRTHTSGTPDHGPRLVTREEYMAAKTAMWKLETVHYVFNIRPTS
jgi:hypothetical protein